MKKNKYALHRWNCRNTERPLKGWGSPGKTRTAQPSISQPEVLIARRLPKMPRGWEPVERGREPWKVYSGKCRQIALRPTQPLDVAKAKARMQSRVIRRLNTARPDRPEDPRDTMPIAGRRLEARGRRRQALLRRRSSREWGRWAARQKYQGNAYVAEATVGF